MRASEWEILPLPTAGARKAVSATTPQPATTLSNLRLNIFVLQKFLLLCIFSSIKYFRSACEILLKSASNYFGL